MDLSIIIVSWNAKDYLYKCLNSVIREARQHKAEVIVVDNASSDGSPEFVREQFPSVKLIRNEANLGFAKANNIGLSSSRGEYIVLINSDVVTQKDCINRLVQYMNEHPQIGILGPRILDSHGKMQRSCMQFPTLWNTFCRAIALDRVFPKSALFGGFLMTYLKHDRASRVEVLNGCFWMVRREALDQVGYLDERFFIYGEDMDWCKRFYQVGWEVVLFRGAEAVHYGAASSSNQPIRFYIEMQRANLQFWRKHHGQLGEKEYLLLIFILHLIRILGHIILYAVKPRKRIKTAFKIKRSLACIFWFLRLEKSTIRRNSTTF